MTPNIHPIRAARRDGESRRWQAFRLLNGCEQRLDQLVVEHRDALDPVQEPHVAERAVEREVDLPRVLVAVFYLHIHG